MMTALCIAAGLLGWICAGLVVALFLFRHRRRAEADFFHVIATYPGMPTERVRANILNPTVFD
jgi:hypothetical protein